MPDAGRAAILGYFPETFLMTATERARARKELLEFAANEGYRMTAIFVEALDTTPAAMEAMVEAACRGGVTAVAIAGPGPLAELYRRELEDAGIRLLITRSRPPSCGGRGASGALPRLA